MTKPLPIGTRNTTLNMSTEERLLWGRAAFLNNETSLNQFLQECALEKLKEVQPILAAEIAKVRKARGMVVTLAKNVSLLTLIGAMAVCGLNARRGARYVRVPRPQFARRIEAV